MIGAPYHGYWRRSCPFVRFLSYPYHSDIGIAFRLICSELHLTLNIVFEAGFNELLVAFLQKDNGFFW